MQPRPGSPLALALRIGAVAVLLVVCAVVALQLVSRDRGAERRAVDDARTFSPPALSTPQPALVSVVADGLAGQPPGSAQAASAPASWISIVPQRVSVRLSPFIYPGSGYTTRGVGDDPNGSTFVTRAGQVSTTSRMVVFMGGAADRDVAKVDLARAATRAFAAVRQSIPRATLIVVGPAWPDSTPPSDVLAVRDTLRASAQLAGATFVDPIAQDWLGGSPTMWDAQGDPTAAGQRRLGTLMTRVIESGLS